MTALHIFIRHFCALGLLSAANGGWMLDSESRSEIEAYIGEIQTSIRGGELSQACLPSRYMDESNDAIEAIPHLTGNDLLSWRYVSAFDNIDVEIIAESAGKRLSIGIELVNNNCATYEVFWLE